MIRWCSSTQVECLPPGLWPFSSQNPIDAPAGIGLKPEENLRGRCALSQFVFGKLSLRDAEHPAELDLREVKSADLPNAAADGREVGSDLLEIVSNIRLTCNRNSCILLLQRIFSFELAGSFISHRVVQSNEFRERVETSCN